MLKYIIIFLLILPTSLAFTATSDNFKLWKSQEGYTTINATNGFTLNSAFYEQNINTSFKSSNYTYCEGFYCLIRILLPPRSSPSGGVEAARLMVCRTNETLILVNEPDEYACITEPAILEIRDGIALISLRSFLVILLLVTSIIFIAEKRKKRFEDYQFKKRTFIKDKDNEEE